MSQRLAELCTTFVENAFGQLAAQIFSTLADHGRLSLPALRQITDITPRRLKGALATLTQHHIVLYHSADEDEPTYFQIDWHAAYVLVRSRKLIALVKDREGEVAAQIVDKITQLGHASIGELEEVFDLVPASKRDSGVDTVEQHISDAGLLNGIAKDVNAKSVANQIHSESTFHCTLGELLRKGCILKVTKQAYIPGPDLVEQLRDTVIAEQFPDGKITGKKKAQEFNMAVNSLKRKWQDDSVFSETKDVKSRGIIKRPDDDNMSSKRKKTHDGLPNGVTHHPKIDCLAASCSCSAQKLPKDMVVRVNVTQFQILFRNQRLQRMATRLLGPVTGAVYGALLQSLEPQVRSVRDTLKIEEVSLSSGDDEIEAMLTASDGDVLKHLDESLDLAATIKGASSKDKLWNGVGKHRGKPQLIDDEDLAELGIKQEQHSDAENDSENDELAEQKERNKRLSLLDTHLQLLAEHPKRFCIRKFSGKETKVNLAALTQSLLDEELDTMINARFDKVATRFVRMIREKGKLDDRQISNMSLMRIVDVRTILTYLQFHGILESQEVPKDTSRQPSRSAYLWWFDQTRVQDRFLQQTYQGMTRSLQRLRIEREERFGQIIEKAERSDVIGKEQERLAVEERDILKQWRDVEAQLLAQVSRLDDVVAVLRDFGDGDTSLAA